MHANAYNLIKDFVQVLPTTRLRIADVGSQNVQAGRPTHRDLMLAQWEYVGMDIVPGNNVDIVVYPYSFPYPDDFFDIAISGSTLEHVEDADKWLKEITRVTKDRVCIVAPSAGDKHYEPDYRRVTPDSLREMMERAGLKDIQITATDIDPWRDIRGIGFK